MYAVIRHRSSTFGSLLLLPKYGKVEVIVESYVNLIEILSYKMLKQTNIMTKRNVLNP